MTTQQWFKNLSFSSVKYLILNCYKIYGIRWSELKEFSNLQKVEILKLGVSVKSFKPKHRSVLLSILISTDHYDDIEPDPRPLPKKHLKTKIDRRYKEEKIPYKTAKLSL